VLDHFGQHFALELIQSCYIHPNSRSARPKRRGSMLVNQRSVEQRFDCKAKESEIRRFWCDSQAAD
jgi:hypothetical protein